MSTLAVVGLSLTIWLVTLFTYILGYQAGRSSRDKPEDMQK